MLYVSERAWVSGLDSDRRNGRGACMGVPPIHSPPRLSLAEVLCGVDHPAKQDVAVDEGSEGAWGASLGAQHESSSPGSIEGLVQA
jgi:hypothetical protein